MSRKGTLEQPNTSTSARLPLASCRRFKMETEKQGEREEGKEGEHKRKVSLLNMRFPATEEIWKKK